MRHHHNRAPLTRTVKKKRATKKKAARKKRATKKKAAKKRGHALVLPLLLVALLACGCRALQDVSLPSPSEVGQTVANEVGIATIYDVEAVKAGVRAEADQLRQHSDAADAALRADLTAADAAIRADLTAADLEGQQAYREAIEQGLSEAEAQARAANARAATAETLARDAARIAEERGAEAADNANKAREGIDGLRSDLDSMSTPSGPEGPVTGIPGWLGFLVDLALVIFAGKAAGKGLKWGAPKAIAALAKPPAPANPPEQQA